MMNRHKEIKKNPMNKKSSKVFYKTQLCPNFDRGTCTRGRMCNYAHGQQELRSKPNLEKTRMCTRVQEGETCENPHCKYAHDLKELKSTKDYYKTSLCIDFKKGFCKAGDFCRYAHGEEELRRRKVVKRDDNYSRESDYQSMNYQRHSRQDNVPVQSHPHYYPQQGMVIGRGHGQMMLPPPQGYPIHPYQMRPPPYANSIPPNQGYYQPTIPQHNGMNMRGRIGEYKNRFTQNPQIVQPGNYQMTEQAKLYDRSLNNNKSMNEEKDIFLKKQQQQNSDEKDQSSFLEKQIQQQQVNNKEETEILDDKKDIKNQQTFLNNKNQYKDFLKKDDNDIDYNPYYLSQQHSESQKDS